LGLSASSLEGTSRAVSPKRKQTACYFFPIFCSKTYDMRKLKFYLFLSFILVSGSLSAQNLFLRVPRIPGEATDKLHPEWIILSSFKQGVSVNSSYARAGSELSAAKAALSEIVVTKKTDKTTPLLMQQCAMGTKYNQVKLEMTDAEGRVYYSLTLVNAMFTGVSTSSACETGCDTEEEVSLVSEKILWEYTTYGQKGEPVKIRAGYDFAQNVKM